MRGCSRCGAKIAYGVDRCPYCGHHTEFGKELESLSLSQREARNQMELHTEWNKQQLTHLSIRNSANWSLWCSLGGLLLCCFPSF